MGGRLHSPADRCNMVSIIGAVVRIFVVDEEKIKLFGGPGRQGRRCKSRGEVGAAFNVQLTGGQRTLKVESSEGAAVVTEEGRSMGAWATGSALARKIDEGLGGKGWGGGLGWVLGISVQRVKMGNSNFDQFWSKSRSKVILKSLSKFKRHLKW
ncbi:hypothetical protein CRG98_030581 [Punica granatum]|uniref:Uncharacterized protein n=1 Tax=Punica granatum TaxID=22663 RepID=A0A2I0IYC5_PUNGR|nr:hypothetical protein CRG98_030581 [Punica granatum]